MLFDKLPGKTPRVALLWRREMFVAVYFLAQSIFGSGHFLIISPVSTITETVFVHRL
ncbi:MAG: hypothetical protein ACI9Y1_000140 [Lentisphaeria bacterium]|jgi:hypothetical protein